MKKVLSIFAAGALAACGQSMGTIYDCGYCTYCEDGECCKNDSGMILEKIDGVAAYRLRNHPKGRDDLVYYEVGPAEDGGRLFLTRHGPDVENNTLIINSDNARFDTSPDSGGECKRRN